MNPWLEEHIECFIRKHLGKVPDVKPDEYCVKMFDQKSIEALKAVWWQTKRLSQGRQILLGGRDVFLFHMLGGMEGYFNIYRPDLSSVTKEHPEFKQYKECYLLDTGHRGSVPQAIGIENYGLIYCSGGPDHIKKHQVFPRMGTGFTTLPGGQGSKPTKGGPSPIYHLYSALEGIPKYETHAQLSANKKDIVQKIGDMANFERAAMVTLHVARNLNLKEKVNAKLILSLGRGI